jgi:hypothetical protein
MVDAMDIERLISPTVVEAILDAILVVRVAVPGLLGPGAKG